MYKFSYRYDVDGMRALAVVLVMLCHAGLSFASGGYVGVDVFFTISGFVVTSIIAKQIQSGEFSVLGFYAKRAKRLMPSLLVVCLFVVLVSVLFSTPDRLYGNIKNIASIFVFLSNYFQASNVGYFAAEADEVPLLHIWSLSVEEQFYLFLPFALYLAIRFIGRHVVTAMVVVFSASLAWAIYLLSRDVGGAYFSFFGRIYEFIPGVLLALLNVQGKFLPKKSVINDVVVIIGLLCLLYCLLFFDKNTPFPGVYALMPVTAAVICIYAVPGSVFIGRIFVNPCMIHLGVLSYCLYLWHWPVYFLLRRFDIPLVSFVALGFALSYSLALATHKYIETPIRHKAMPNLRAIGLFIGTPLIFSMALLGLAKSTNEMSFLYPSQMKNLYDNAKMTVWDAPRAVKCWGKTEVTDPQICHVGAAPQGAKQRGFLWGDSHAYQMIEFVDQLGKDQGISIQDAAYSTCPPLQEMAAQPGDIALRETDKVCAQRNNKIMQYLLLHSEIKIVYFSAAWSAYNNVDSDKPGPHGFVRNEFQNKLASTVATLVKNGKQVVLFNDIPYMPKSLINCDLYNNLYFSNRKTCSFPMSASTAGYDQFMPILKKLAKQYPNVTLLDTYNAFCNNGSCALSLNGTPVYRNGDYGHLNLNGSRSLYQLYLKKSNAINRSSSLMQSAGF